MIRRRFISFVSTFCGKSIKIYPSGVIFLLKILEQNTMQLPAAGSVPSASKDQLGEAVPWQFVNSFRKRIVVAYLTWQDFHYQWLQCWKLCYSSYKRTSITKMCKGLIE